MKTYDRATNNAKEPVFEQQGLRRESLTAEEYLLGVMVVYFKKEGITSKDHQQPYTNGHYVDPGEPLLPEYEFILCHNSNLEFTIGNYYLK